GCRRASDGRARPGGGRGDRARDGPQGARDPGDAGAPHGGGASRAEAMSATKTAPAGRPAGTRPIAAASAPRVTVELTVNGKRRRVAAPPMTRLLDALREDLALPGTKEGCGECECGAWEAPETAGHVERRARVPRGAGPAARAAERGSRPDEVRHLAALGRRAQEPRPRASGAPRLGRERAARAARGRDGSVRLPQR